jgi:hypothetical protein
MFSSSPVFLLKYFGSLGPVDIFPTAIWPGNLSQDGSFYFQLLLFERTLGFKIWELEHLQPSQIMYISHENVCMFYFHGQWGELTFYSEFSHKNLKANKGFLVACEVTEHFSSQKHPIDYKTSGLYTFFLSRNNLIFLLDTNVFCKNTLFKTCYRHKK